METQTVPEMCGFGKGISISHLKFTAGAPISRQPVETLGWPCPAELCHTEGKEYHAELGLLEHISHKA